MGRVRPGTKDARGRPGKRIVMSSTPDEITIEYEESGQILIKEIDKVILSKGAWTTILFRYQELDTETGGYGPDKYAIRRYQKSGGEYRQKSKFNISSAEQARKIVDALSGWLSSARPPPFPPQWTSALTATPSFWIRANGCVSRG